MGGIIELKGERACGLCCSPVGIWSQPPKFSKFMFMQLQFWAYLVAA